MSIDLSTMNRKDLEKLRKDIDKQIDRLNKADQKAAFEAADRAAREHGFTLAELTGASPAKAGRTKSVNPPRYRNPENPGQTWTGKGRRPDWIKAAQDNGVDLSTFEIG